ncbi:glycosyltransferase family 2 protein [Massilia sp.]|uniref:glycosyltransferase n=1 Tax=Massilia sp. TaxID=1882437 RepID=UPI00352CC019
MHGSETPADAVRSIASRTALILETNNLRGGGNVEEALASLKRLVTRLALQTVAPATLAQWIITHDGIDAAARAEIVRLAGRTIDFVPISASDSYYEAKNAGFDHADPERCDYVAFCDADCNPAARWLEHLLLPFTAPAADAPLVVAGRTSYSSSAFGVALTSIDFMYFPSTLGTGATSNFYANNVAFRREVFDKYRYQELPGVYRAHCQVMGMRLLADGVKLHYAVDAHTEHRLPDTRRELFKLRWMRGEDSVSLTPYLVRSQLPSSFQWLARSGPIGPGCVMAARLFYSLKALNRQDLPPLRGLQLPLGVLLLLGLSAIDTCGAITRSLIAMFSPAPDRKLEALSYHRH